MAFTALKGIPRKRKAKRAPSRRSQPSQEPTWENWEELTGEQIQECIALVAVEGLNAFQMFVCNPLDYIDELVDLRKRYENIYGV